MVAIGIIGGSGLDDPAILKQPEEKILTTPYGDPSSPVTCGEIRGAQVAILARHGKKHTIYPSAVNYRANIWALKSLGVEQILSVSAVGSLQEQFRPGQFVLCDQLIDRTRTRESTFFGGGVVGHVAGVAG